MLCAAMAPRLQLKRSPPSAGLEHETARSAGQPLHTELPGLLAFFEGSPIRTHSIKAQAEHFIEMWGWREQGEEEGGGVSSFLSDLYALAYFPSCSRNINLLLHFLLCLTLYLF